MAKGLRSSVKKFNKSKLRSNIFGPVEDARTERLSAKLLELASLPKPGKENKMEVEKTTSTQPEQNEVMDVDDQSSKKSKFSSKRKSGCTSRHKRVGKPHSKMVFSHYSKSRRSGSGRK
ncbi:MAG: hypothetical protein M1834_000334 [Cirrosporium novae-zelandiae]|nr:MAG: hypothetical protein M1834_000334 [Cirrosporium novae-zelandiae]